MSSVPTGGQPPDDRSREQHSQHLLMLWQKDADLEALDQLLRIEIETLKNILKSKGRRLLSPSMSATDAAQEAVIRMLNVKSPPKLENPAALRAYLWKAAWRLLARRARRRGRDLLRISDASSQMLADRTSKAADRGTPEFAERSAALNLTLNLLKPTEREVLDLVYFKQLPLEQVADQLKTTRDAANMRLVRARRKLAQKLRSWTELLG